MRILFIILSFTSIFLFHTSPALSQSQREKVLSGDIEFEDAKSSGEKPYLVNQNAAIAWVDSINQSITQGGHGNISALSKDAMFHIAVSFLYCVTKIGNCVFVLDTVLEADIINARGNSANECPMMTSFWRLWLEQELGQRVNYLAPVGSVQKINEFNKNDRPRYVKCKDTVGKTLAETKDSKAMEARYAPKGAVSLAAQKTKKLLDDIKSKGTDLFGVTGVLVDPKQTSGKKR